MSDSSPGLHNPAIPAYILRGHTSPIHALHFFRSNAFLASGDAQGWIVVWSLTTKRAAAVWKAHEGSILGLKDWADDRLVTHGRDHRLRVWQVRIDDFAVLDTKLPVEKRGLDDQGREPWLLHSMAVNALNFCAFAMCFGDTRTRKLNHESEARNTPETKDGSGADEGQARPLLENTIRDVIIAVPNALDSGGIDFFHLPSERRVSVLHTDRSLNTNMVMAVSLFHHPSTGRLTVVSGYEDGHTMVHVRQDRNQESDPWVWLKVRQSRPHSQPLLSLDVLPTLDNYVTSSADATIAKFTTPGSTAGAKVENIAAKSIHTKHAGQQSLRVRNDGKIFATAGWDAKIRVYSTKTMRELAVLKWHKEGSYAVAFADVHHNVELGSKVPQSPSSELTKVGNGTALDVIKQERSIKAQKTHWLAAGGKDGKISLWDIY